MPSSITFRFLISLLGLSACAHRGGGEGELEEVAGAASGADLPVGQVEFHWKSGASANEGTISATLPDGLSFEGTYLQVTETSWQPTYGPYWLAWTQSDWGLPPWYGGPQISFATEYSDHALAVLTGSDGTRMRCVFTLRDPKSGLTGGGEGDCQLSTEEKIVGARLYEEVKEP